MSGQGYQHSPVLLNETLEGLVRDPGGLYVDATLGLGGHSEGLLLKLSPQGRLLGLDMDPEAIAEAKGRLGADPRFRSALSNFRALPQLLEAKKFFPLAGILFDLGVSSLHFDKASRGFSFSKEGPLDMRLSPENPLTAEAIVNRWPEEQIEMILREYGEEPAAGKIARAIVARREQRPITTTTELARVVGALGARGGIHPATKTFMALRIAVNAELENLTRALEGVVGYLGQGGRLAVITFHSLEDRIVKTLFSSFVALGSCRTVSPPIRPSREEVGRNPRARSAKLRILEKR